MREIAIEGGDACGKATQAIEVGKRLPGGALIVSQPWNGRSAALAADGRVAGIELAEFTIAGALHGLIRSALKSGWALRWPTLFQLAQLASKLSCRRAVRQIARDRGVSWIVFDRDALSALVYGLVSGASRWSLWLTEKLLRLPALSIVIDRAIQHAEEPTRELDSYELDSGLQRRVRFRFKTAAHDRDPAFDRVNGDRVVVVSGHGSVSEVSDRVMAAISSKLLASVLEEEESI